MFGLSSLTDRKEMVLSIRSHKFLQFIPSQIFLLCSLLVLFFPLRCSIALLNFFFVIENVLFVIGDIENVNGRFVILLCCRLLFVSSIFLIYLPSRLLVRFLVLLHWNFIRKGANLFVHISILSTLPTPLHSIKTLYLCVWWSVRENQNFK